MSLRALVLFLATVLTGCGTAAQRDESVNKDVASEVKRICALPKAQQEAELKRVKAESGIILYCSD